MSGRRTSPWWVALLVCGCAEQHDRPPPADLTCPEDDPTCLGLGVPGGTGIGGSAGEVGGSGGSAAEALEGDTDVVGTVVEYASDDFLLVADYPGVAEVFAENSTGERVAAVYDGVNPFQLQGIAAEPGVWVGVTPAVVSSDFLTTLQQVDPTLGLPLEVALARASTVDVILGLLTAPAIRDPAAAQVLLGFFTESGAGVPSIVVTPANAEGVAYRVGGTWSDAEAGTGSDGLALVYNQAALALPGADVAIAYAGAQSSGTLRPRVAADAFSLMFVAVAP